MSFNCYVCCLIRPKVVKHVHHKTPRSAGGSDDADNLVDLCNACHNNTHLIADMLSVSHKVGRVNDMLLSIWPDNLVAHMRCLELAIAIHHAKILKKDGVIGPDNSPLEFDIPTEYKMLLKQLAVENKTSVSGYLKNLVLAHLASRFPAINSKILSNLYK